MSSDTKQTFNFYINRNYVVTAREVSFEAREDDVLIGTLTMSIINLHGIVDLLQRTVDSTLLSLNNAANSIQTNLKLN